MGSSAAYRNLHFTKHWGYLAGDLGQDVGLAQHEELLALDGDLGAAVLGVEDLVALLHVERNALVVVAELAVTDGENLAALRLLLGRIGEDDAARRRLLLLYRLDDQAIAQGLELHAQPPQTGLDSALGTLATRVPNANESFALGEGSGGLAVGST